MISPELLIDKQTTPRELGELNEADQARFFEKFCETIEPLYGDQSEVLAKIQAGIDRWATVLMRDDEPVGTLVYKIDLQTEHGLDNAFEIKTLCLFDAERNSGKGYATNLLEAAEAAAQERQARAMFVTVAGDKPEVQAFFEKQGFGCVARLPEKFRAGVDELVYVKMLEQES